MKRKMKVVLIIIAAVVIVVIAVCVIMALTGRKPFNVMDGDGMINPNAVIMQCEPVQGEYERGVGSRVIIEGTHFIQKAENDNIIDTDIVDAYETSDSPGRITLVLKDNSLYYDGEVKATVNKCFWENSEIHLIVDYSFGQRENVFNLTDRSEFYYYDIVTEEYMSELEGTWRDGDRSIVIKNGMIECYYNDHMLGSAEEICVVRENQSSDGRIYITNANLYINGLNEYNKIEYKDGMLVTTTAVLDSDESEEVTFTRDAD